VILPLPDRQAYRHRSLHHLFRLRVRLPFLFVWFWSLSAFSVFVLVGWPILDLQLPTWFRSKLVLRSQSLARWAFVIGSRSFSRPGSTLEGEVVLNGASLEIRSLRCCDRVYRHARHLYGSSDDISIDTLWSTLSRIPFKTSCWLGLTVQPQLPALSGNHERLSSGLGTHETSRTERCTPHTFVWEAFLPGGYVF
jgi:hypothetical protein